MPSVSKPSASPAVSGLSRPSDALPKSQRKEAGTSPRGVGEKLASVAKDVFGGAAGGCYGGAVIAGVGAFAVGSVGSFFLGPELLMSVPLAAAAGCAVGAPLGAFAGFVTGVSSESDSSAAVGEPAQGN